MADPLVVTVADAGKKGGAARAANLTPKQRAAAAKKANRARWLKYYQEHPERVRPKRKRKAA